MAMTQEQAADQARKLKKQGASWKDIEEHLKNAGYVSARTRKPIKELAIRMLIAREEQREREEALKDAAEERRINTQVEKSIKDSLKTLMKLDSFAPNVRLKMLEVLADNNTDLKTIMNLDGFAPETRLKLLQVFIENDEQGRVLA